MLCWGRVLKGLASTGAGRKGAGWPVEENLPLEMNNGALGKNFMVFSFNFCGVNVGFINVLLNSDIWETATLNTYLESLSKLDYYLDTLHFSLCIFKNLSDFMERNCFFSVVAK